MYRDRMTLRQVWVRIRSLPDDSPLMAAIRDAQEKADEDQKVRAIADALAPFQRPG